MNDTNPIDTTSKAPSYYNPTAVARDSIDTNTPLVNIEPPEENPRFEMQRRYPLKTIAGIMVLALMVLAVPATVLITQQQTNLLLEANTPAPVLTFPPTPSPSPTIIPIN